MPAATQGGGDGVRQVFDAGVEPLAVRKVLEHHLDYYYYQQLLYPILWCFQPVEIINKRELL